MDTWQPEVGYSAGGDPGGLDQPVHISWDFDMEVEEAMVTAGDTSISWDVDPESPAEEAAVDFIAEEADASISGGLDIDWDVQMTAVDVGVAPHVEADIDWDVSPLQATGGVTASTSTGEAILCGQAKVEGTNSVVTGLMKNSDFRNRCPPHDSLPPSTGCVLPHQAAVQQL